MKQELKALRLMVWLPLEQAYVERMHIGVSKSNTIDDIRELVSHWDLQDYANRTQSLIEIWADNLYSGLDNTTTIGRAYPKAVSNNRKYLVKYGYYGSDNIMQHHEVLFTDSGDAESYYYNKKYEFIKKFRKCNIIVNEYDVVFVSHGETIAYIEAEEMEEI